MNRFKAMLCRYKELARLYRDPSGMKYCLDNDDFSKGIRSIEAKLENDCQGFARLDAMFGGRQNIVPTFTEETGLNSGSIDDFSTFDDNETEEEEKEEEEEEDASNDKNQQCNLSVASGSASVDRNNTSFDSATSKRSSDLDSQSSQRDRPPLKRKAADFSTSWTEMKKRELQMRESENSQAFEFKKLEILEARKTQVILKLIDQGKSSEEIEEFTKKLFS